jgi:hypothetical protein
MEFVPPKLLCNLLFDLENEEDNELSEKKWHHSISHHSPFITLNFSRFLFYVWWPSRSYTSILELLCNLLFDWENEENRKMRKAWTYLKSEKDYAKVTSLHITSFDLLFHVLLLFHVNYREWHSINGDVCNIHINLY